MEREQERRDPVGEPHGDHAERAAGHDGDPHHGDELKRVAESAHRVGEVGTPEIGSFAQHGYCRPTVAIRAAGIDFARIHLVHTCDKSGRRRRGGQLTEVGLGQLGLGQRGSELLAEDAALARAGLAILDANWLGHATRASSRLYPHQWSWDAACIAIAYSHFDQARAETELRSLFEGQWRNGLLPHIRFTDGARYFPGPEFWQTELSPDAPAHPRTSGIVQPPVHATAVWQVYRNAPDTERAEAFLRELMPRLVAWHDYLYRERTRDGEGLVEIWHPWESGIDNSPLWDEALARITPPPDEIPEYQRVDTEVVDSSQRPTNAEYDRYAYLVKCYRERGLRPGADPRRVPVRDPGRPLQRDPRHGRARTSRRSPASSARTPSRSSALPQRHDRASTRSSGASRTACTWTTTCAPTRRCRRPHLGRPGAALLRRRRPSGRSRLLETVREFAVTLDGGWAVPSVSARRSLVRPGPLLARAGLAHDQLGHPSRAPPARLRRRGGAAPRRPSSTSPAAAASGSTTTRRPARGRAPSTCPGPPRSCSTSYSPARATRLSLRASVEKGVDHASESARAGRRPSWPSECWRLRPEPAPPPTGRSGRRQRRLPVDAVERDHRERGLPQPDRQGLLGIGRQDRRPARERDVLPRPDQGRVGRRQGHGQPPRRRARRLPHDHPVPDRPERRRQGPAEGRHPGRALHARQARDEQAVLHPVDAGVVRHGRQQEGAQRPAEGRRHQPPLLRPALQVGQEHCRSTTAARSSASRPARRGCSRASSRAT